MISNPLYSNSDSENHNMMDSIKGSFAFSSKSWIALQTFPPGRFSTYYFLMLDPTNSCSLKSLDQIFQVKRSSVLLAHDRPIDVQLTVVLAIKLLTYSHFTVSTPPKASALFWDLTGLFMVKFQPITFFESWFLGLSISPDSKLMCSSEFSYMLTMLR